MNKSSLKNTHNGHHSEYDLADDIEKIKASLSDLTRDFKGKTGELYGHSIDHIKEKSSDIQNDLSKYVTKKPLKSVSIALAIGIALGYLLRK